MPEPKIVAKAAEAPVEEEYMPEGDAPFSETTDKAAAEAEKESAGDISEEAKEIADAITPGEAEGAEPAEEAEEVDEVEEILAEPKTPEDKSKVQRRIDELTREKKIMEERLAKLESEKDTREGKIPEYSDAQLRTAMKKALDEGDADLAMDIQDYRFKKMEEKMVKMYRDDKENAMKAAQAIQSEWDQVTSAYDKYADTKIQPLYPGSQKDLNIRDATSLLYQVAMALYTDPEKEKFYRGPGGQKLAVADALTYILSKKAGKGKDSEKEKLKRQLIKEKRKKSIISGSPGEETKAPKGRLSESERLEEVIAERRKFQEERAS